MNSEKEVSSQALSGLWGSRWGAIRLASHTEVTPDPDLKLVAPSSPIYPWCLPGTAPSSGIFLFTLRRPPNRSFGSSSLGSQYREQISCSSSLDPLQGSFTGSASLKYITQGAHSSASVSLKEVGDAVRLGPHIALGGSTPDFCRNLPAKLSEMDCRVASPSAQEHYWTAGEGTAREWWNWDWGGSWTVRASFGEGQDLDPVTLPGSAHLDETWGWAELRSCKLQQVGREVSLLHRSQLQRQGFWGLSLCSQELPGLLAEQWCNFTIRVYFKTKLTRAY